MEKDFELKLVNLKKTLGYGDLARISEAANVSVVTTQQMFKAKKFDDLQPAMKRALDAAIDFGRKKKKRDDEMMDNLMDV